MRIVVIFLFIHWFSVAQVLDNRTGEAFTDRPFFNEDFIKENKLKSLKGSFVYQKKGQLMKPTKFKYVYQFDQQGHLSSTFETRSDDGLKDTTWNTYSYNDTGELILHRKTDQDGYNTVAYTYDDKGRVIEENYMREIDSNNQIIRTLNFNKESIKYVDSELQTKCTRYNNYDLPYLDVFVNYNEFSYLVERVEKFKMASIIYRYAYEYNEHGQLSAIRKSSNQQDEYLEELLFRYDDLGNLIEKHVYKKGVFITDIQIIYNSKSKLLATVITRQVSTGFMMILRFKEYEFYD
ncbi:MAG: hypothetical protein P8N52_03565 [Crocinitomicaceae bacterium]|nr:hypothetical protein [Crocinitomicaceae bacterium]MDG1776049.1 hypothetical protein [Crocinitomicaceae bacterium]